jgi:hypothetical protein
MAALTSKHGLLWETRSSTLHGHGLFATCEIGKGALILTEQPLASLCTSLYRFVPS